MSSNRPELKIAGRTLRASVAWWLALALLLALAHLVHTPSSALAEEPCFLDEAGILICPEPETPVPTGPRPLINDAAYRDMTSAQAAAMHRFEDQAVAAVLDAHGLPASDASDVRNWASDEAAGVLQLLVFEAISTSPDERTFDQKQIAGWMGDLMAARTRPGMMQVGAEYAAWAGLSVSRYWELVNSSASQSELTAFLSRRPQPYNGSSPETSTGGFCKYVPPAPYADEYKGREWQTCFTPCTSALDKCQPPVQFDQFVRWGEARVASRDQASADEIAYVGAAMTAGGWFLAALGDAGLTFSAENAISLVKELLPSPNNWPAEMVSELGSTFFDEEGTKFMVKDLQKSHEILRRNLAEALEMIHETVDEERQGWMELRDHLRRQMYQMEQEVNRVAKWSRVGFGFAAEVVVFAYTTIIEETIKTVQEHEVPGQIASKAIAARTVEFEPSAFSVFPGGSAALRSLFASSVSTGVLTHQCSEQCPALARVRAASPTDPHFMVAAPGAPTWIQTSSLRLGKVEDDRWAATNVRASGHWVVERWYDDDHGPDIQSLKLHYTNWNMQPETAWLIPHEDGEYSFKVVSPETKATFNLATCHEDHTCWTTNAIHYLNSDGNPRKAFLEPYQPSTGSPTASALAPLLGRAVTFNAGNFAPGDPRGMVTYRWRFQKEGCLASCTIVEGGRTVPDYSAAVAGPVVTRTWQTPGSYQVELTATDGVGHTAVKTLTVNVASG